MQREQLLRTVSLAAVSVQFAAQHLTEYAQQDALPRMMALGTLTSECFLSSSGTMPLHTAPLCHQNQHINLRRLGRHRSPLFCRLVQAKQSRVWIASPLPLLALISAGQGALHNDIRRLA